VVPGFVVQFGLPADPSTAKSYARIQDDPVKRSNKRGSITFASAGPNSRSNQLFINLQDNPRLDGACWRPRRRFGLMGRRQEWGLALWAKSSPAWSLVRRGARTSSLTPLPACNLPVDRINPEYGEKPDQGRISSQGLKYLDQYFPRLSYIARTSAGRGSGASGAAVEEAALPGGAGAPADLAGPGPVPLDPGLALAFFLLLLLGLAAGVRCWKKMADKKDP
jgi:hypothetical protein